jgi:hypothetical protein
MAPVENLPAPIRDAVKKYGSWKNIPRAEKNKILAMGPELLAGMLGGGGFGALGGGDPFQDVFDGLDGKPPADPNKGPDGWIKSSVLQYPEPFDPKMVNAGVALVWVLAEATRLYPDALLFGLDAHNMNMTLLMDVSTPPASFAARFITPSRKNGQCAFRITIDASGPRVAPDTATKDCKKEVLLGAPKCQLLEIWQRAIQSGASATERAKLSFTQKAGKGHWVFQIGSTAPKNFADDCGAAQ